MRTGLRVARKLLDHQDMSVDDVEQAITTAAASKCDADYKSFFATACGVEFFFSVRESNGRMIVPLRDVGQGLRAIVFYTYKEKASRLGKCAGIEWTRGLEMVLRMPEADGLVVENSAADWIAMNRGGIGRLLEDISSAEIAGKVTRA